MELSRIPFCKANASKELSTSTEDLLKEGVIDAKLRDALSTYDHFRRVGDYVLVMDGAKCGIMSLTGDLLTDVKYYTIIPPDRCRRQRFVLKIYGDKWAVFEPGQKIITVKYYHMWGYSRDLCLVSQSKSTKDRAVIDSDMNEVIPFNKYTSIWDFYGKQFGTLRCERAELLVDHLCAAPHRIIRIKENVR